MLAVLMMLPEPCAFMIGAACLMPMKTLRSSTSIVRSYSSTGMSSIGPTVPTMPALLKMQSSRPYSFIARPIAARMSSSVATSVRWYTALEPSSAASRAPASSWMSATTMRAPSAANSRTVASPMPLAPPVITAALPSSLPMPTSRFFVGCRMVGERAVTNQS